MCFYYEDYCEVWLDSHPKARKAHKCHDCRGTINPGEVYQRINYVFDGSAGSHKVCAKCEAVRDAVAEIERSHDCGNVFGWDNLPKECLGCKARLRDSTELGRGLCPACHLKTYSPEKRAALNKLIGLAFKPGGATDAEKDAAIDEAFKHLD